jgi:hypothetical protein
MFSLEEQTNFSLFLLFRFIPYRGELFGLANLLKFKDGTFMDYAPTEQRQYGVGVHQLENLLQTVEGMTEEEFAAIGDDDNMFEDLARRTAGWLRFRTICFCTRRNFLTSIIYTGAKDDDENDDDDDDDIDSVRFLGAKVKSCLTFAIAQRYTLMTMKPQLVKWQTRVLWQWVNAVWKRLGYRLLCALNWEM